MTKIISITPSFAVTGALGPHDFGELAELGFKTVIGNRTDAEVPAHLSSANLARAAADEGVTYIHVPASKFELFTDAVIDGVASAVAVADGPVLAHCASGQRSAIIWAATQVRTRPVAEVMQDLANAGFKLDFIRDDLEAQADRARWSEPAPKAIATPADSQATRRVAA